MKMRFQDMIEQYIECEIKRLIKKTEKEKRGILEEFAFFMDRRRQGLWKITEITEDDARAYYKSLKRAGRDRARRIQVLNHFMDCAVKEGWIKKRPWKELRRGAVKDSKREERLVKILRKRKEEEFYRQRDRAMLLLYLEYGLSAQEISTLNIADFAYNVLKTRLSSCEELKLKGDDGRILADYLSAREAAPGKEEEALFTGAKTGKRISPKAAGYSLRKYISDIEED